LEVQGEGAKRVCEGPHEEKGFKVLVHFKNIHIYIYIYIKILI